MQIILELSRSNKEEVLNLLEILCNYLRALGYTTNLYIYQWANSSKDLILL